MGYDTSAVRECVSRVKEGETIADVSRDTGISESAISAWCRNAGVKPKTKRRVWTTAELKLFAQMWSNGASYDEMSVELGRTVTALQRYVYQHHDMFPPRERGPKRLSLRVRELEAEVLRLRGIIRRLGFEP